MKIIGLTALDKNELSRKGVRMSGDLEKGVRRIGSRVYKVRPDERLIGERDGWELSELEDWSKDGWISLRVLDTRSDRGEARGAPRMRVYQIGYNTAQGRIARNIYWWKLSEHWPDIASWVLETIRENKNDRR